MNIQFIKKHSIYGYFQHLTDNVARGYIYIPPDIIKIKDNYKTIITPAGEIKFRLTEYITPTSLKCFTFGAWALEPRYRPDGGGEWISKSEIINQIFSIDLLEIAINDSQFAMYRKDIIKLIPDNIYMEYHHYWKGEVTVFTQEFLNNNPNHVCMVIPNNLPAIIEESEPIRPVFPHGQPENN